MQWEWEWICVMGMGLCAGADLLVPGLLCCENGQPKPEQVFSVVHLELSLGGGGRGGRKEGGGRDGGKGGREEGGGRGRGRKGEGKREGNICVVN